MRKYLKDILKFLVFLSAGLGILVWIFRKQDKMYRADCALKGISEEECNLWVKLQADFLSVDYFWILMVLLAFMISNLSRAHRWQMLMRGIGMRTRFGNAFFTIMFGYMANLAIPRIGEVLRGTALARYEKHPVEKVLGTIVVDRAVDVVVLLLAIALAFLLEYDVLYDYLVDNFGESRFTNGLLWKITAIVAAAMATLWFVRKPLMRTRWFGKLRQVISGFVDGLRSIRKVDNIPLFLFHTVAIWFMYYSMTLLAFRAFDATEHLGMLPALMTFVFGGLGIVFPSPGGMGTYHAMVMASLMLYGVAGNDAFSFANILYFSVQICCNILFGLIALGALPLINRKTKAYEQQDH